MRVKNKIIPNQFFNENINKTSFARILIFEYNLFVTFNNHFRNTYIVMMCIFIDELLSHIIRLQNTLFAIQDIFNEFKIGKIKAKKWVTHLQL